MVSPYEVRSPMKRWRLIDVLINEEDWSLAVGDWDFDRVLACRWNGDAEHPKGNPVSRGEPTWFVLPSELVEAILEIVPNEKKALAKALFKAAA